MPTHHRPNIRLRDTTSPHRSRGRDRLVGSLGAFVVCVLAFAVLAPSALAADASSPQGAVESWALAPSGSDPGQPGSRPNLSYTIAPGGSVSDSVTLWNYSNVQLTFHVYATDAFNNSEGGFDVLTGAKPPKDVGTWVTFPQNALTVPPRTSVELPITITVPPTALPGDHAGAVIASSPTPATDKEGHNIVVDRRTGSRIYLRVSGPVKPSLVVENIASDYHGSLNPLDGSMDVTYTVRNSGNVRLGAKQKVELHDVFGTVDTKKPAALPELLPGNSITQTVHFSGVAATVRVTSKITLAPVAAADAKFKAPVSATASGHAWAIPWTVVILLALIVLAWRLTRRFQRGRTQGRPQSPPGSGAGPRTPQGGPTPGMARTPVPSNGSVRAARAP